MNDIVFLLIKKKIKKDQPTDPPNFQAKKGKQTLPKVYQQCLPLVSEDLELSPNFLTMTS